MVKERKLLNKTATKQHVIELSTLTEMGVWLRTFPWYARHSCTLCCFSYYRWYSSGCGCFIKHARMTNQSWGYMACERDNLCTKQILESCKTSGEALSMLWKCWTLPSKWSTWTLGFNGTFFFCFVFFLMKRCLRCGSVHVVWGC